MPKYQFTAEVQPQYLPDQSSPDEGVYGFAYTITITNTGTVPAQLIARHWIITNELGHAFDSDWFRLRQRENPYAELG